MNRDLFLAILSMDSYNRGYGAGILGLSETGSIGNATIGANSSVLRDINNLRLDIPAGFYALAYDVSGVAGFGAGERVIAYRGTNPFSLDATLRDVINGWSTFTGFGTNSQFGLARAFNKAVTRSDFLVGTGPLSNAVLTGHSLGGALAGHVAVNDNQRPELSGMMGGEWRCGFLNGVQHWRSLRRV